MEGQILQDSAPREGRQKSGSQTDSGRWSPGLRGEGWVLDGERVSVWGAEKVLDGPW